MRVIYGIHNISGLKKPAVALGVFDGVHRGHRVILSAAVRAARKIGGTSVAMTFWPHPRGKQSLYSLEHRLRIIAETGIDAAVVVNFDRRFAAMTADDFIAKVLIRRMRVRAVCVGDDYHFGRGARGNRGLLADEGRAGGFSVLSFKPVLAGGKPVSSTLIRSLIREGRLGAAQRLLARPVSVLGTVVRGGAWAGKMGFPTANIDPHHEVIPPSGIYAARIVAAGRAMDGVCYIGTDPTLRLRRPLHVEAHIFDFKKNIYGSILEVQFLKRIRSEQTFPGTAALVSRIKKDILTARRYFKARREK